MEVCPLLNGDEGGAHGEGIVEKEEGIGREKGGEADRINEKMLFK